MRLGGGGALVGPQLLGPEPRDPHVPVTLQHQLYIPHLINNLGAKWCYLVFMYTIYVYYILCCITICE